MQLNKDVFPDPLGPITASVSPSRISRPKPASAVIPPNRRVRSLTRSSASSAIPSPLVLRREDLVAGDLLHAGIGGLPGPHHAHRVVAVMTIRAKSNARGEPTVVVVLDGLHGLHEALPGEVLAGALQSFDEDGHVGCALDAEALAPLQLRVDLGDDLDVAVGGGLAADRLRRVEVSALPEIAQQPKHGVPVVKSEGREDLGSVADLGHLLDQPRSV